MNPFDVMKKSAAFSFSGLKGLAKALHSGAKAEHAGARIAHANKIIKNYKGNYGMGWRVNRAQNTVNKFQPLQKQYTRAYDSYLKNLNPSQAKALNRGRTVLSTIYDIPKLVTFNPTSRTGILGSVGIHTAAGLTGLNIDPLNRLGQLHGATNAKQIAKEYGTQGGYEGINQLANDFESLSMGDRMRLAQNPNILVEGTGPGSDTNTSTNFNVSDFVLGRPSYMGGPIRGGIQEEINKVKMP